MPGYPSTYGSVYPAAPSTLSVVNAWPLADATGYGPAQASIDNTTGHALIAWVASGSDNQSGYVPRHAISDDIHNWWTYAGRAMSNTGRQVRAVDIWVCPNAEAATVVNFSANMITGGMVGQVVEISGFPQYATVDFVATATGTGSSVTTSGTATVADYVFTATGWFSLNPISITGPTGAIGEGLQYSGMPYTGMGHCYGELWIQQSPVGAGAVSQAVSWGDSMQYAQVTVGFQVSPPTPAQPNSNWPSLKVEAAFGFKPASMDGSMPVWTDITSRATDEDGVTVLSATRGRDYELTQPEAADITLELLNTDGALNPANTASPYYPNVVAELPVRVSAFWQGRQYGLAYGYVSDVPQDFPDPQWGVSNFKLSDALGIAGQGQMPSALAGQVLADFAYSYYALGEYYQTAHGFPFDNSSRVNTTPMIGYSPSYLASEYQLQTGQTLNLQGDSSTGIGLSGLTLAQMTASPLTATGAFVRDYGLPQPGNGIAIEFWAIVTRVSASPANTTQVTLAYLSGQPSNYSNPANIRITASQPSATGTINYNLGLATQSPSAGNINVTFESGVASGTLAHVVLNITYTGTEWVCVPYFNGVGSTQYTLATAAGLGAIYTLCAMMQDPSFGAGNVLNAAMGQLAVYPWMLPEQRIISHYETGSAADNGDTLAVRIGKLFGWAGLGLPFGCAISSPTPLLGNADQISGSALADNLYSVSTDEGGFYYAPATALGEIWYASRTSLYNKTPKATFGDNGSSEIPYDAGSGFDYSDQYLFNIVSSTRTIAASTQITIATNGEAASQQYNSYGADAITEDQTSEAEYWPRGPLQQDIETTSDQDAYDRANWTLAKYKQPQLRANQILVDCAAHPAAFATMLDIEQGDVVTVTRRPIGAAVISVNCIVQQVKHEIGPDVWNTTLTLAPYFPENAVIQLNNSSFDELGDGALGW